MIKIVRVILYISTVLFLLDVFNVFQTRIEFLKMCIYFCVSGFSIPLLILEFKEKEKLNESIVRKAFPFLVIVGLLYINPMVILFNLQPWKTQTIVRYIDQNSNHKIEKQTKDVGALGYAKRKVEVYDLSEYFYIILDKNSK